ncbi:unnamed protein product, partial [Musa acuminata var. zebrina]
DTFSTDHDSDTSTNHDQKTVARTDPTYTLKLWLYKMDYLRLGIRAHKRFTLRVMLLL